MRSTSSLPAAESSNLGQLGDLQAKEPGLPAGAALTVGDGIPRSCCGWEARRAQEEHAGIAQ